MIDETIVRCEIHPAIGIARIGDSQEGFYIGPEVCNPPSEPASVYRGLDGSLKRQAARFRIYGYNAAGEVVKEVTDPEYSITWRAHLVNRKAAWYRFIQALDIPQSKDLQTTIRRNASVPFGERDASLVIDPGEKEISGVMASVPLDGGVFMKETPVSLGELQTDYAGRLLVLGGLGISASPTNAPIYTPDDPDSFNNANQWYDDTADGTIDATVNIDGREVPVEGAWVVVAPPNYAPDVIAWRTLYDLLEETYIEAGWLPYPESISFSRDIYPVLQRLSGLQWVNAGFSAMFGPGRPFDMNDPVLMSKLASNGDATKELRRTVMNTFRSPQTLANNPGAWPWIYGDGFGTNDSAAPNNNLMLSQVRWLMLQSWADGHFVADWNSEMLFPRTLDDIPLAEQPAMLTKAALHFCLADAFHPGCELTWPMRHTTLFSKPFRIRRRPAGQTEANYGSVLTQEKALAINGPLYGQSPGDLSRWMALPWQADTAFCRSGYDAQFDPFLPTFWPARVPNQVLTLSNYQVVMNLELPREVRLAAFNRRDNWEPALPPGTSTADYMLHMVNNFQKQGVVTLCPGVEGDPDLPPLIWVSLTDQCLDAEGMPRSPATPAEHFTLTAEHFRHPVGKLHLAGWDSEEQLDAFRKVVRW